jgi:hypothetical protein
VQHPFAVIDRFGEADDDGIEIVPRLDLEETSCVTADDNPFVTGTFDPIGEQLANFAGVGGLLGFDRMNRRSLAEDLFDLMPGFSVGPLDSGLIIDREDVEDRACG